MKTLKPNPLEKRIRRHVIGKKKVFFCVTAPGFEKILKEEIIELGIDPEAISVKKGGVEFTGRIHDCYLANLFLRTAGRILMRIGKFKATNFNQLKKQIESIPWELYLSAGCSPDILVTSRHSRLFHKKAISDRFFSGIASRFKKIGLSPEISSQSKPHQKIFIRFTDDRYTVSLDSSGENLYQRGIKTQGGHAPIRETTAAAILKLSGYDVSKPLIDPMCGAGTFSLEAAMISQKIPAGWYRHFSFFNWPCFKPKRWAHIKLKAKQMIVQSEKSSIFASDIDKTACHNLKKVIKKNSLLKTIQVNQLDFFSLEPLRLSKIPGLIVFNPPYGLRIGNRKLSRTMYLKIFERLINDFRDWKFAILVPGEVTAGRIPFELTQQRLMHGGLLLTLLTGGIK